MLIEKLKSKFLHWFSHGWQVIERQGASPWRTHKFKLSSDAIWDKYLDPERIVGLRFGSTTRYVALDIDAGSPLHPDADKKYFRRMLHSLEDIGLCRPVILQSSSSGGLHVYWFFDEAISTYGAACALNHQLRESGFELRDGKLEQFPNKKPWTQGPSPFKGLRLPLQEGGYLLGDDLESLGNSLELFLGFADQSARANDVDQFKAAIAIAPRKSDRSDVNSESAGYSAWIADWEKQIERGWSGKGQTNELVRIITAYGIVALKLSGNELVDHSIKVCKSAPGFLEFCGHVREIGDRVRAWAATHEKNKYYVSYRGHPARGELQQRSFDEEYNNIIRFNRINENRSKAAMDRLVATIADLGGDKELPSGAVERAKVISDRMQALFGFRISNHSLYKPDYLLIWHPKYIREGVPNSCCSDVTDALEPALATCTSISTKPQNQATEGVSHTPPLYEGLNTRLSEAAPQGQASLTHSNHSRGGTGGDFATRLRLQVELADKGRENFRQMRLDKGGNLSASAQAFWSKYCRMSLYYASGYPALVAEALTWLEENPSVGVSGDSFYQKYGDYHNPVIRG